MARQISLIPMILIVVLGCQQQRVVTDLPAPSFAGPNVAAPVQQSPAVQPWTPGKSTPPRAGSSAVPSAWIPTVRANNWQWIVIHHSATPSGNAARFDREHKAKGWDELGYHFVIDNGSGGGDGAVEVGPRWPKQKWGAHAKTADNRFNDRGIGICLVGNFDVTRPTPAQMQSLAKLVAFLQRTYNIPSDRILGHGQTKATDCPGKNLSIAQVKRMAQQVLASSGGAAPGNSSTASAGTEMLRDR